MAPKHGPGTSPMPCRQKTEQNRGMEITIDRNKKGGKKKKLNF